MYNLYIGIAIFVFGITIGGVGIASAGVGIGIPMIPIGIYLMIKGWRIYLHNKSEKKETIELECFEKTKLGKIGIGVLLLLIGIGTSAIIIGIPIIFIGVFFIYSALKNDLQKFLKTIKKRK